MAELAGRAHAAGLLHDVRGFVRLGMVHYNTIEEIDHVLKVLDEIAASLR